MLAPLFLSLASAQSGGVLKVRVTYPDDRPCTVQVHVQLMSSASTTVVEESFTNQEAMAEFDDVAAGTYHVIVSGQGIEEADSGIFEVDHRRSSQSIFVVVKPTPDEKQAASGGKGSSTVASADLNIPANAAKEFDKATELMAKQDWKKAIEQLNKAVAIYPQYAAAYNNLGAIYARQGDRDHEREALQKAVSLNDHFAPAFVNLAKMDIADHDLPGAEALLEKATSTDPLNSPTLILLANVELLNQHYDQSIANCRKAHSLPGPHAMAHYIAAHALQDKNESSEAAAELQTFLKEEPNGGMSDAVRKQLSSLQAQPH